MDGNDDALYYVKWTVCVIGAVLGVVLIFVIAYYCCFSKSKGQRAKKDNSGAATIVKDTSAPVVAAPSTRSKTLPVMITVPSLTNSSVVTGATLDEVLPAMMLDSETPKVQSKKNFVRPKWLHMSSSESESCHQLIVSRNYPSKNFPRTMPIYLSTNWISVGLR